MPEHTNIHIETLMQQSGVTFGTSGARGLACDMRNHVCYAYTLAFLQYLMEQGDIQSGDGVALAGDYRPSTPRIMNAVAHAIVDAGCKVIHCGFIPTPAVAYFAMQHGMASIMVTGSHIPDDRNGIKFYKPAGEILKHDEQAMCARSVCLPENKQNLADDDWENMLPDVDSRARQSYIRRYLDIFPADALQGWRIGVYEHSTVLRDIMAEVLQAMGATIIRLGRSEHFIPVDTEAIRPEDVMLAEQWQAEHQLDAIVSADGDGDRPLIAHEHGQWLRGDIAGVLCARYLQAESIVTPVSSNTAVEKSGLFKQVRRTRIGSPYVIEAMNQAVQAGEQAVMGYEANGGFLIATDIILNGHRLAALPTRDALIVLLSVLLLAKEQKRTISQLCSDLPPRFTSSGRLKNFPNDTSKACLQRLTHIDEAKRVFSSLFGSVRSIDTTDGVRITFENEEVVHLRASGNAPEFRCYNEADSEARAIEMNSICLELMEEWR